MRKLLLIEDDGRKSYATVDSKSIDIHGTITKTGKVYRTRTVKEKEVASKVYEAWSRNKFSINRNFSLKVSDDGWFRFEDENWIISGTYIEM